MSKVTFTEKAADAATPASGQVSLFAKDRVLHIVDDLGVVSELSAGKTTDDILFPNTIVTTISEVDLTGILNAVQSAGLTGGGVITAGVGQSGDVSSSFGGLRSTNAEDGVLFAVEFPAKSTLAVPTDENISIGVRFNAGVPEIFSKTVNVWNYNDEFPLGAAVNEAGVVEFVNDPHKMSNLPGKILQRLYETDPLAVDLRTGGFIISDSGDGARNIRMTEGALWDRLNRLVIPSVDTGAGDNFTRYYRDGIGGFVLENNQTTWDNTSFDDGTGTLNTLTTDFFSNQWVWTDILNGELLLMYGTEEHATVVDAENENVPLDQPDLIKDAGRLLGRIIAKQGVNIAALVQSVNDFTPELADITNHSNLTNLGADDHTQYSLADGTRAFTGEVGGVTPTLAASLATKGYIDGKIITFTDKRVPFSDVSGVLTDTSGFTFDATSKVLTLQSVTGISHIFLGDSSGANITAVGQDSNPNLLGNNNTTFGRSAGLVLSALSNGNTLAGRNAGSGISDGVGNVGVGHFVMGGGSTSTGDNNIFMGNQVHAFSTFTGDNNTLLENAFISMPSSSTSNYLSLRSTIFADTSSKHVRLGGSGVVAGPETLRVEGDTIGTGDIEALGVIKGIEITQATETTPDTTTGVFSLIVGMSIIPAAGTYFVTFSASGSNSANASLNEIRMVLGIVPIAHTGRSNQGGTGGNQFSDQAFSFHSQSIMAVNGVQAISVEFQTSAGTLTLDERSLMLIRMS